MKHPQRHDLTAIPVSFRAGVSFASKTLLSSPIPIVSRFPRKSTVCSPTGGMTHVRDGVANQKPRIIAATMTGHAWKALRTGMGAYRSSMKSNIT